MATLTDDDLAELQAYIARLHARLSEVEGQLDMLHEVCRSA